MMLYMHCCSILSLSLEFAVPSTVAGLIAEFSYRAGFLIEAVKASSALRADFIAKATEAMNIMNTPLEKGGNWGMAQNRGAEMARLIRLLKKLG